jgi:hypothetical protein
MGAMKTLLHLSIYRGESLDNLVPRLQASSPANAQNKRTSPSIWQL